MLTLNFTIAATDHDLALVAAFRVATGRINGIIFIVEVSSSPLLIPIA
jgi:hypothetical protein